MDQLKEEDRKRKAFKQKGCTGKKSTDSWVIFKAIDLFPIDLVRKLYWEGILFRIKSLILTAYENINKNDLDLAAHENTRKEAIAFIDENYSKYLLSPNY